MKEMKDKQVLIVGMPEAAWRAARMLSRLGAKLTLTDTRNSEQMASAIEQLSDIDADWRLGTEPDALIEGKDYIILSPSVYYWAPWVEKAKQNGTEVVSELQLGAWFTQGDFGRRDGHQRQNHHHHADWRNFQGKRKPHDVLGNTAYRSAPRLLGYAKGRRHRL